MVERKGDQSCFVVFPIGPGGSVNRDRIDGIFREVIEPIADEFGYRAEIAIPSDNPSVITEGIVSRLIEADLVVADLHGRDGNVMYEVAIRHGTGEPIIHMIPEGEEPLFDLTGARIEQNSRLRVQDGPEVQPRLAPNVRSASGSWRGSRPAPG